MGYIRGNSLVGGLHLCCLSLVGSYDLISKTFEPSCIIMSVVSM